MAMKPIHPNKGPTPPEAAPHPQKTKAAVPPQDSGEKASAMGPAKGAKDTVSIGPKREGRKV